MSIISLYTSKKKLIIEIKSTTYNRCKIIYVWFVCWIRSKRCQKSHQEIWHVRKSEDWILLRCPLSSNWYIDLMHSPKNSRNFFIATKSWYCLERQRNWNSKVMLRKVRKGELTLLDFKIACKTRIVRKV